MAAEQENAGERTVVRICVVDAFPITRAGIKAVIHSEPDLKVCGEANNVAGALAGIKATNPDLALVDFDLRNGGGLTLITALVRRRPSLPVLVQSRHAQVFYAEQALKAGARGYVEKTAPIGTLITGIREILKGHIFVSAALNSRLLARMISGGATVQEVGESRLSVQELAVFELIGLGLSMKEVAQKLSISAKTVECHRAHIKRKLALNSASGILKEAIQWVHSRGS
jgi:DNA-binding NarL/FixJ family response regulator